MALFAYLNDGDIELTKAQMSDLMRVSAVAAYQYAQACLGCASDVLDVAMTGGPCAAAYQNVQLQQTYDGLAREALDAATSAANLLLQLNASDDDEAMDTYSDFLMDQIKTDQISAMLEGSRNRIAMAHRAMPENPTPAARFNADAYATAEGAQENDNG